MIGAGRDRVDSRCSWCGINLKLRELHIWTFMVNKQSALVWGRSVSCPWALHEPRFWQINIIDKKTHKVAPENSFEENSRIGKNRNHLAENKAARKRWRTGTYLTPASTKTTQNQWHRRKGWFSPNTPRMSEWRREEEKRGKPASFKENEAAFLLCFLQVMHICAFWLRREFNCWFLSC